MQTKKCRREKIFGISFALPNILLTFAVVKLRIHNLQEYIWKQEKRQFPKGKRSGKRKIKYQLRKELSPEGWQDYTKGKFIMIKMWIFLI